MTVLMRAGEPVSLLDYGSGLITAVDPRRTNPFERQSDDSEPKLTIDELTGMLADTELPETTALLTIIGQLGGDDLVRARARKAVARRLDPMPEWLARLGQASVYRTVEMTEALGDGEDIMLGIRLASGDEITLLVYVDHNLGSVAKDGFSVPGPIGEVVKTLLTRAGDPDTTLRDIDGADARARLEEAIGHGARMWPPLESDSWPGSRPLVEWATRKLPEGGRGYEHREWSEKERKALGRQFLASEFAAGLDSADHRGLLDDILWYGTDYGPGDPLRWSPVAVEIVLVDWIPRKIRAEVSYLTKAPEVLRAFIRFAHAERGIRPELTADTLSAVDDFEPEYQRVIRSPRPQGPAALLAAMGALDPDAELPDEMWADGRRRPAGRLSRAGDLRRPLLAAARPGVPHGLPAAAEPGRRRRSSDVPAASKARDDRRGGVLGHRKDQRPVQPVGREDAGQGSDGGVRDLVEQSLPARGCHLAGGRHRARRRRDLPRDPGAARVPAAQAHHRVARPDQGTAS
jgi:hypothetical protein